MGGFGRNWYETKLAGSSDVQIVAFVDPVTEALEATRALVASAGTPGAPADGPRADEVPAASPRYHHKLEEALASVEADAVLVTASLPGHAPAAGAALAAGKHVLMEKPFAPSVAEARALVEQAEQAKRVLMISQNYRYFPAVRRAQEIVSTGVLGRLGVVHIDFRRNHIERKAFLAKHYALENPLLADMAIHHFDLMRMITGENARRIRCYAYNPPWSLYTDYPAAEATVEMESGLLVTYRGSWVSPGAITPWTGDWHLEFEKGELFFHGRWDDSARGDAVSIRYGAKGPNSAGTGSAGYVEERLEETKNTDRLGSLAEFVSCIRNGRTPQTAGAANIGSIALTYAAIKASKEGGWVEVES